MKRRTWSWGELREWTIKTQFSDYEEKAVFLNVLYKGQFYDLTFIQKKKECTICEELRPSYAIVATQSEFVAGHNYDRTVSHYEAVVKMLKTITKDEGNRLYKKIKATKSTTKNSNVMYRLTEEIA